MTREYFRVRLTPEAVEVLRRIGKRYGKNNYEVLRDRIRGLEFEPEKKGQALRGQLHGLYSLHYARFRVIYEIRKTEALVLVIGGGFHKSGDRDDVYQLLRRALADGRVIIQTRPSESETEPDSESRA